MAKYFITLYRTLLGRVLANLLKPKKASQEKTKKYPPPNDADSRIHPRRRTAGAGPDAISTGPPCFFDLSAHRATYYH